MREKEENKWEREHVRWHKTNVKTLSLKFFGWKNEKNEKERKWRMSRQFFWKALKIVKRKMSSLFAFLEKMKKSKVKTSHKIIWKVNLLYVDNVLKCNLKPFVNVCPF